MSSKVDTPDKERTCQVEHVEPEGILKIMERHRNGRAVLISILEDIQAEYGYLPEDALRLVAKKTGCSLVEVYGVATFYHSFSLKPRGKHLISVCVGTACHVRGGPAVAEEFKRQLGINIGETTPDMEFTLVTVNCVGACALGPIVVVDGHYFSHVNPAKVKRILAKVRMGLDWVDAKADKRVVLLDVSCPYCGRGLMDADHPIDGHPSILTMATYNGLSGWVRLSSLYGSYTVESELDAPVGADVEFFCPHCHHTLTSASKCPECGSVMAGMRIDCGGIVQTCSHHGCKGHTLDLARGAPRQNAAHGNKTG